MEGLTTGKILKMDTARWVKIIFVLFLLILLSLAAIYLAGFFVLIAFKISPTQVDFSTYYAYWQNYHTNPIYQKRINVSAIFACIIAYGIPIALYIHELRRNVEALHGSARFATTSEIAKSGLLGSEGIIVGKLKNQYLMFGGEQFVLLAAPTRTGKGVGIVIPNLLNYPHSIVVIDIKQENFELTAGFRQKHGQQVFLFNPFAEDLRTHRYNPLGYVRDGIFRVGDLIAIGEVLYPTGNNKDAFFDDQARNVFVGLGLYLCETPELPRTIGEMLRQSSGNGQPIKRYLENIIAERAKSDRPLSQECVHALRRFTNTYDNTLSSILASFNAPLGIWANPIVDAATSANDFDLRLVRKQHITIYIGITPDHLAEVSRLINLLFSQLINLNTKESPQKNPDLKYPCLLLMDEFTAIGRLNILSKAIGYIASYNLRFLTIVQAISQLDSAYGKKDAETIITNHALQILYAPRVKEDAEEYSKILGDKTVKNKSKTRQMGGGRASRSESESDQKRALLLPQEVKEIGQWKEIIDLENTKPILCEKINYRTDPVFVERILPPPNIPLLNIDTHNAIVEKRYRDMTLEDVTDGVDLKKVALDTSKLDKIDSDHVKPEDAERVAHVFFDSLPENR